MVASVQFRPQSRDLGMVMREVDEDLAIFLGMRTGHLLVENSQDLFDDSKEPKSETEVVVQYDSILKLDVDSNGSNWLLSQMDTSLLPPEKAHAQDSAANLTEAPNSGGSYVKSEVMLENTSEESASLSEVTGDNRPSSTGDRKPTSRAATPTRRPTFPAKSRPSRASTPNSRATFPSSKPVAAQVRSSTPVRATSRSSTPASRPSIPVTSKSAGRSSTPSRKPNTPSTASGRKEGSTAMVKNPVSSRGTSPTVKSRSSKPSEVLPQRPASASRARSNMTATAHPRQKSCSPAKVRGSTTTAHKTGSKFLLRSSAYSNDDDNTNPVKIGAKMVDRVVNMRKLAPPKQDDYYADNNRRKSFNENSGFGRTLSKTSLDMALRHMDIGRSIPNKTRSRGGGSCKNDGASESTFTSSCDSSKCSIKEAHRLDT